MKKFLSVFLAALMLLTSFSCVSFAANGQTSYVKMYKMSLEEKTAENLYIIPIIATPTGKAIMVFFNKDENPADNPFAQKYYIKGAYILADENSKEIDFMAATNAQLEYEYDVQEGVDLPKKRHYVCYLSNLGQDFSKVIFFTVDGTDVEFFRIDTDGTHIPLDQSMIYASDYVKEGDSFAFVPVPHKTKSISELTMFRYFDSDRAYEIMSNENIVGKELEADADGAYYIPSVQYDTILEAYNAADESLSGIALFLYNFGQFFLTIFTWFFGIFKVKD